MSMLDDLRKSTALDTHEEIEEADLLIDDGEERVQKRFLGMTAVQRMFLAMFFFMNVLVIGAALLLVTGRLSP